MNSNLFYHAPLNKHYLYQLFPLHQILLLVIYRLYKYPIYWQKSNQQPKIKDQYHKYQMDKSVTRSYTLHRLPIMPLPLPNLQSIIFLIPQNLEHYLNHLHLNQM
jgi:hypothetical protein